MIAASLFALGLPTLAAAQRREDRTLITQAPITAIRGDGGAAGA